MKKNNVVAIILKVYACVNFFACLIIGPKIADDFIPYRFESSFTTYFILVAVVVNFGIYAFGEVVQLLHDIKINTQKAQDEQKDNLKDIEANLPEM